MSETLDKTGLQALLDGSPFTRFLSVTVTECDPDAGNPAHGWLAANPWWSNRRAD